MCVEKLTDESNSDVVYIVAGSLVGIILISVVVVLLVGCYKAGKCSRTGKVGPKKTKKAKKKAKSKTSMQIEKRISMRVFDASGPVFVFRHNNTVCARGML